MATPLETKLIKRLKAGKLMNVAAFMQAALLDEDHGYYTHERVFGADGDFITAPEISQIFGEILAAYIGAHAGQLKDYALIELGPGRGTLMKDMLRTLGSMPAGVKPSEVVMVEASGQLAKLQKQTLAGIDTQISWQNNIENLPSKPCVIVANEFFDALPIQQFIWQGNGWYERVLELQNNKLGWALDDKQANIASHAAATHGDMLESHAATEEIMQQLAEHVQQHGGMMIAIDYGYTQPAFGDTLQALKAHQYVDTLEHIGEADITAHVNFTALKDVAEQAGLKTAALTTQGQFLQQLGAAVRAQALCAKATPTQQQEIISGLTRLMAPEQMGDLFKVLVLAHANLDLIEIL